MRTHSIHESSSIARNLELITVEVDGEVVMMNLEQGDCYGLDSVGSQIWVLLDNPLRVSELVGRLLDQYDVDRETCVQETLEFLQEMVDDGLLELRSE